MTDVTRTEIIDHVADAFTRGPATTSDVVAAARATNARPEALAVLARLPEQRFIEARDLWAVLPDLPIGG